MGRRSCALLAGGALLAVAAGVRMPEMAHSHVPALANGSRASAGAEEAVSPIVCLARLATSGFSITDVDRFGEWFSEESKMTLAETGTYTGFEAIKEYVEYITDRSPYIARSKYFVQKPDVKSADASMRECVVNVFSASSQELAFSSQPTTKVVSRVALVQLTFTPKGSTGLTVTKANVYYPRAVFEVVGNKLHKDPELDARSIDYICSNMEPSCPETWAHNGYSSKADCTADYSALPKVTYARGEPRFDGNSLACKMLHSAFAFKNPHHCAHISVKPMADPDGKIKCQTSSEVVASDLFDPEDLQDLASFAAQKGYPPEGAYLCDCEKDGRFTWWPGHVNRCVLC